MKSWHLDDGELYNKLDSLSQFNSFDTQVKWTWRNFNPSWSHQIEHRTGNWFIHFSQNWRVISRKKLYGACTLTKGYHHAKEDRICFFEVCHSFAILFESCTDLLLNYINLWQRITVYLEIPFQNKNPYLWQGPDLLIHTFIFVKYCNVLHFLIIQ